MAARKNQGVGLGVFAGLLGRGRAPDPNWKSMWQDPIYGYYESHGKTEFKKGESYNLSPKEQEAVMERYRMKEQLKLEYLRREFDPIKRRYTPGVIIDPAMFRWYAADMTGFEVFRMSPKTLFGVVLFVVIPTFLFMRGGMKQTIMSLMSSKVNKSFRKYSKNDVAVVITSGGIACAEMALRLLLGKAYLVARRIHSHIIVYMDIPAVFLLVRSIL